jgi:hypothetical protein
MIFENQISCSCSVALFYESEAQQFKTIQDLSLKGKKDKIDVE